MARQYKAMRDEMEKKIHELEANAQTCADKLDQSRHSMEQMIEQKDEIIAQKNREIAEQRQRMDEMAAEFALMLKSTLDKMSEKIVVTNETVDNTSYQRHQSQSQLQLQQHDARQQKQPSVRRFEEFRLA